MNPLKKLEEMEAALMEASPVVLAKKAVAAAKENKNAMKMAIIFVEPSKISVTTSRGVPLADQLGSFNQVFAVQLRDELLKSFGRVKGRARR